MIHDIAQDWATSSVWISTARSGTRPYKQTREFKQFTNQTGSEH